MTKEEKCRKTQKNRIVISKDNIEKRIYKNNLDKYLKDGWSLGQSEKHKENQKDKNNGKTPWNKGTKGVMKRNKTTFNKGQVAWNKGLKKTIVPENTKIAIADDYAKANIKVKELIKKYSYSQFTIREVLKEKGVTKPHNTFKVGHEVSIDTQNKISDKNKNHKVSQKTREAVSAANKKRTPSNLKIQVSKAWLTRKKNNTYNTSQPEIELYEELLKNNVNKTILRQYKDARYPYHCDFYIVEDDLFIELNAHWTHGGHPFNENDPEDLSKLNSWKEKAKTSKFYAQAIITWTVRDVEKQKCAKENNLNYKVIY